jgi:hypothetical protein
MAAFGAASQLAAAAPSQLPPELASVHCPLHVPSAGQVHAGIDAELGALAGDFGIDASTLQAKFGGDVSAALRASTSELKASVDAALRVNAALGL